MTYGGCPSCRVSCSTHILCLRSWALSWSYTHTHTHTSSCTHSGWLLTLSALAWTNCICRSVRGSTKGGLGGFPGTSSSSVKPPPTHGFLSRLLRFFLAALPSKQTKSRHFNSHSPHSGRHIPAIFYSPPLRDPVDLIDCSLVYWIRQRSFL